MQRDKYMKKGQTVLMLLVISLILVTFVTTMVAMVFTIGRDTTTLGKGETALAIAESGTENAILRLLRNSNYTGETGLTIGGGQVEIAVTGTTTKTITTNVVFENVKRTVKADVAIVNGQLSVVSWSQN